MKLTRIELRVPESLKKDLELAAKRDGRSLNNYMNKVLLEKTKGEKQ